MTAVEARTHLRYSGWASRKALDAALALSPADQSKPMGVSHESILGTLGHIYMADRIWYKRVVEPDLHMPPMAEMATREALTGDWQELQKRWEAWADSAVDADIDRSVSFTMRDGTRGQTPASQLVMHVVNHATLHRGQVVGMLRQMGVKPPNTDFFFYLRDLSQNKLETQKL